MIEWKYFNQHILDEMIYFHIRKAFLAVLQQSSDIEHKKISPISLKYEKYCL